MSNSNYRTRKAARHTRKAEALSLALALATPEAPVAETRQLWVVTAYCADGDKAYLDDWCIVHAGHSYEEARDRALEIDSWACTDTNDNPCPPTRLELRDPENDRDWELREYLEYRAECSRRAAQTSARFADDPKFQEAWAVA